MTIKAFARVFLVLIIFLCFVLFWVFDLHQYLSLAYIQENLRNFRSYYALNPWQTTLLFTGIYIVSTSLSLPGASLLSILAGALFGLGQGLIIVSFASTIGACFAFMASRFLLRDYVQNKYGHKLKTVQEGIKREGHFYLLSMRMIPVFPFFLINLLMGPTSMSLMTFYLVSQIGMLPGTVVYVNAGEQLAHLQSLSEITSPKLLFSFALLGVLPIALKTLLGKFREIKLYAPYNRPKKYDYNLIVIGAGSAGLVSSYIASVTRAKVALIEKHKMGGDCLNTGCVPSKALLKSAKVYWNQRNSDKYGIDSPQNLPPLQFSKVMKRVHNIIAKVEPHDSVERYSKLGVNCIKGEATLQDPYRVKVNGEVLSAKNIILATGAGPFIPEIKGLRECKYLTSDTIWQLQELPKTLVIMGAGPIGLEMAQAFHRFGSEVTVIERNPQILKKEDKDIADCLLKELRAEGIRFLLSHQVIEVCSASKEGDGEREAKINKKQILCENLYNKEIVKIPFEHLLVAVGRKANTKSLGLENLGIATRADGTIEANEYMQTSFPNILTCGDVTGPYQLTHTAAHQAWYACVNGLFGRWKKFKVDYRVIPWCTYTDPEVAHVGQTEKTARAEGIAYEVTTYGIDDLDRAITESEDRGMVKVLTAKGSDRIIGATIVASNASDMILEFITAMKHSLGLNKILGTIHVYPSMGEANKYAAGVWKKNHAPEKLLSIVEKFHQKNL